MNDRKLLREQLLDPRPDFNQIINTFISGYNEAKGIFDKDQWIVSKDEWQRYEFLGDRVLNLIAADFLYHHAPADCEEENCEGWMTKKMGVVSNESLAGIIEHKNFDIALLIPGVILQQQTYGDRIKGGALEAVIGALYEMAGYEETRTLILNLLSEEIEQYDPATNYIGCLQEKHQKDGLPVPLYSEITDKRHGPVHSPRFTCQVSAADGTFLGEGTGRTLTEAKQAAAKKALDN